MENFGYRPHYIRRRNLKILLYSYAYKPTVLDCERSLFCSKIRYRKNAKQVSVPSIASVMHCELDMRAAGSEYRWRSYPATCAVLKSIHRNTDDAG